MKRKEQKQHKKKSIFRALFIPLFLMMLLQSIIFYFTAIYGGIQHSLKQNAADILYERLINRKNEIETLMCSKWIDLEDCQQTLQEVYSTYENNHGAYPFSGDEALQIQYLRDNTDTLISTLRHNGVNGIFLILNDQKVYETLADGEIVDRYGLCIRDMDQASNYSDRKDLLLERAPSSMVDSLGCSLDSWWEARYRFSSKKNGDYYYAPLDAAWANQGTDGRNLAYFSGIHQISASDQMVASYSVPLTSSDGYPFGVIGIELSKKYLTTLLPNAELGDTDKSGYVLALQDTKTKECVPIAGTGALFNRSFGSDTVISCANTSEYGGFVTNGRDNNGIYGVSAALDIYTNNNPFGNKQLVLLAMVENHTLFAYINHIKLILMLVSIISMVIGVIGILWVSKRFASPVTALSKKVRGMSSDSEFALERLGITEIDQLVDAIEELNRNVSRNSARTEFFSRMSHDMRTPMNAIIGFSSLELLEEASEEVKTDYLNKINSSGKYLLGLINEVLDMTKIESNRTDLHTETVCAAHLCENVIPVIDKLAAEKGVNFKKYICIPGELFVEADVQHLNQIVMNLLSNAVKFTPEAGTVLLEVKISETDEKENRCRCRMTIRDNGIGMSEAFMKQLYTPFEQENRTGEGTGLGLSIAKKLVELMGGTIVCDSYQNKGTTFTIEISLEKSQMEHIQKLSQTEANARADLTVLYGKRILICEDQPLNVQIVTRLLEREKITVFEAADGKAGVDIFMKHPERFFDAILMDIRMPVMDGLTAAKMIRSQKRIDAAQIPIIAMTANAFAEDVIASKEAGMNAHLAKPVEPQKLYETLVQLL